MFRQMTKDHGRFKKGDVLNYPNDVWKTIANSSLKSRRHGMIIQNEAFDWRKELGLFSKEVEDIVRNQFAAARHRIAARAARGLAPE